jgi:pilus assembly protein TadC
MLDVHAPHGPTHSWRDFLIHIAAIAIGLLLALALEKLAEYIHERRQLTEARRELTMEV